MKSRSLPDEDDFAAAVLERARGKSDSEAHLPILAETAEALRQSARKVGLDVHKEEFGRKVTSLGMQLESEPPRMSPQEEKFWLLYEATLFLAQSHEAPAI